jgi:hypothetical protein
MVSVCDKNIKIIFLEYIKENRKKQYALLDVFTLSLQKCDPGGIRTRDQELKRLLLYR